MDHKDFYIPESGDCFLRCIEYILKDESKKIVPFYREIQKNKNYNNGEFAKKDIPTFVKKCKEIGIELNLCYFRTNGQKPFVKGISGPKYCLHCVEGHWVYIKTNARAIKLVEKIAQSWKKEKENFDYDTVQLKYNTQTCDSFEQQMENVYIFDLETIQVGPKSIPYACGLISCKDNSRPIIFDGYDCFEKCVKYLELRHKPKCTVYNKADYDEEGLKQLR